MGVASSGGAGGAEFGPSSKVWITGASSGLGEATALAFARRGCTVVLSARRRSELERVAAACAASGAVATAIVELDQASPASIERAIGAALGEMCGCDVVVLCGGVGARASALETDGATLRRIVDVNFVAAAEIGAAAARRMLADGVAGRIVVVSSVQGFFGLPNRGPYAASKHALHGFFDSLRAELAGKAQLTGAPAVSVTLVAPGYIKTAHSRNALTSDGGAYGCDDATTAQGAEPGDVAELLVAAAGRRDAELIVAPGTSALVARLLRSLAPNALFGLMASRARKEAAIANNKS